MNLLCNICVVLSAPGKLEGEPERKMSMKINRKPKRDRAKGGRGQVYQVWPLCSVLMA